MRMWIRFFCSTPPKKTRRRHDNFPSPCFLPLLLLLLSFMARFFLWRQGRRKGASFVDPRKRRRNGVYNNNIQFPRRLAQKKQKKQHSTFDGVLCYRVCTNNGGILKIPTRIITMCQTVCFAKGFFCWISCRNGLVACFFSFAPQSSLNFRCFYWTDTLRENWREGNNEKSP